MLYDIVTAHALPGEYVFLALTLAAAWMTGRSVASDWDNPILLVVYSLLLGAAARFLHYALYNASFLSLTHYLIDTIALAAVTWVGYQMTRTNQMTQQYHWLYEKASPFSWRAKKDS